MPKELITDVQDFVEYRLQPYVGKEFFDHLADYTVRYNSVDYKFDTAKSITFSGATFIGVGCHPIKTAACSPLTSSDVPFAIFRAAASPSVVWDNEPAFIDIHNIIDGNKDIEIFHTNVKQLDRKYIPDNRFIVTATADNNSNPTADKTFTEIKAAYDAGRTVVMGTPAGLAPLSEISDNGAAFRINLSRGLGVGSFGEFYMYPDNTIEMSDPVRIPFPSATEPSAPGTASVGASNNYARADHVHPSELPEYSDADAGKVLTVAGKADVQWQLPSAGADTSLGMTGATVGQIAKITAVDDSGKPTAWEAVDMPSGGAGETWEKIAEIVIPDGAEETNALTINKDIDGNPFALIKARLCVKQPKYTGSSNIPTYCFAMINGKTAGRIAPLAYTNAFCAPSKSLVTGTVYEVDVSGAQQIETIYRSGNGGWSGDTSADYIVYGSHGVNLIFGKYIGDTLWAKPITSIGGAGMLIYPGCRFVLYGVRA